MRPDQFMHSQKTSLDVSKPLFSMEENVLSATPKVENTNKKDDYGKEDNHFDR